MKKPSVTLVAALIGSLLMADVVALVARSGSDGAPAATDAPSTRAPRGDAGDGRGGNADGRGGNGGGSGGKDGGNAGAGSNGGGGAPIEDLFYAPPAPGVYAHDTLVRSSSSTGDSSEEEGVTTYTHRPAARAGDAFSQVIVIRRKGTGTAERRTNSWRPDGIYRARDERGGNPCVYDPPRLFLRFPITQGDSWSHEGTGCRGEQQQEGFSYELTETTTVLRRETVRVGGVAVECWVVEVATEAQVESPQGSGETTQTSLLWYAPSHRLFVKTETTGKASFTIAGVPQTGETYNLSVLRSLDPR